MGKSDIELIDFKGKFAEYYMKWSVEHKDEIDDEETDEQDLYDQLYEKWMKTENAEFGGVSPSEYFEKTDDKRMLLSALIDYIKEDISIPDALLDSIVNAKTETYPMIISIIMDDSQYEDISDDIRNDLRAECIGLIWNMGLDHPYLRYAELLLREEEESALAEALCEALMDRGGEIDDRLHEGYDNAGTYAKICIIDILSTKTDERGKDLILSELDKKEMDRLYLCSKLVNYYDDDVKDRLLSELRDPSNDYFIYRELRNLYEEYTGEELENVDFSGDPTYEMEKYLFEDDEENGEN